MKLYFYKCAHFLLVWLLSTFWIYHFDSYSISFLLLYLSFHLESLHFYPYSPHFHPDFLNSLNFHPDCLHFHPDSPHHQAESPHFHHIPRISTIILGIPLILFLNSPFQLLQVTSSVCNFQKFILRN